MLIAVEGVYRNGRIELNETPPGFEDGDAVVLYLQKKAATLPRADPQYIRFGMYPELLVLTDEDFRSAEFHGDPDDGLDWSGC